MYYWLKTMCSPGNGGLDNPVYTCLPHYVNNRGGAGHFRPNWSSTTYLLSFAAGGWCTVHLPKATTSYLPVPNVHVGIIQSITSIQNPEQYRANEELRPKQQYDLSRFIFISIARVELAASPIDLIWTKTRGCIS